MAVFKCKMCGGSLEIVEGQTVCECEYCGTQQTLPKTGNEQQLNLINRANHFRQQCEFDKAAEIYEKIAAQSDGDAEIYWSLVLCRYGIEYVDDPATKKKIATCHRTQYRSVLDDPDYQSALQYADMMQKSVYEREAAYIDMVQKGILEISNKEEPFDVFICYKESDENGRRTPDSVLAQELYYCLVQEGFKVFFSRITLESKLGTEYEPYIFAALNSAKVMVVVGTKPEYFNAVWVKNEWSRYLMLMQEDRSRTLIPAYKDMDPYDLPDALSMFQAQDMSKLGFMQDLIRGIRKLAKSEPETPAAPVVQQTVVQTHTSSNIENLLKRGYLSLEDGNWEDANRFFEEVLNENAEEYRAYIGLLCAEYEISDESKFVEIQFENTKCVGLSTDSPEFADSNNFKKACRFGGAEVEKRFLDYAAQGKYKKAVSILNSSTNLDQVNWARRLFKELGDYSDSPQKISECEEKKLLIRYNDAVHLMTLAQSQEELLKVKEQFQRLGDYMDSPQKVEECTAKLLELKYCKAKEWLDKSGTEEDVKKAIKLFEDIKEYKDSSEMLQRCNEKIQRLQQELIDAENKRKAAKKRYIIILISAAAVSVTAMVLIAVWPNVKTEMNYNKAVTLFENEDYAEAEKLLVELNGYKNSQGYIEKITEIKTEAKYNEAIVLFENEDYTGAENTFAELGEYKDSQDHIRKISELKKETKYNEAVSLFENEDYTEAENLFTELGQYKDSKAYIEKVKDAKYNKAVSLFENGEYDESRELFVLLDHYKDTDKYLYKVAKVGDEVKFGEYDWYVIDRTEDDVQLLCKAIVEKMAFDDSGNGNWENCSLREWLNNDFYNTFTDEEKSMIKDIKSKNGGNDTFDKIYLLSEDEALKLSEDIRKCSFWWWLRSPYNNYDYIVFYVSSSGSSKYGDLYGPANMCGGVRPALNLNL